MMLQMILEPGFEGVSVRGVDCEISHIGWREQSIS